MLPRPSNYGGHRDSYHRPNTTVELFLIANNIAGSTHPAPKGPLPCSTSIQHTPLIIRILVKHSLLVSGVLSQGQRENQQYGRPPGRGLSSPAARDSLNRYLP
jgi:hypothetical protein